MNPLEAISRKALAEALEPDVAAEMLESYSCYIPSEAALRAIQSAILAERERAAAVADKHAAMCSERRIEVLYAQAASNQIAEAIRSGS